MRVFQSIIVPFSIAVICTPFVYMSVFLVHAQVMQSTNYTIERDSINFGGGFSSSTNYVLESTAGEVATGDRASTNFNLKGGYQQITNDYISLSDASNILLTPSIPGLTGGESNGSTTVTVITDSPSGYQLLIQASQSPAMVSGANTITDYVPGGNPDYTFTYSGAQAYFGYSPSGADTVNRFKDNGSLCNTGVLETQLACWDGLSTTTETIAQGVGANTPSGATTTVNFRVGIGGSVGQEEGLYVATTTLTAIAL